MMRLFIAINFSDEIKSKLLQNIEQLKKCSAKGNFTRPENLHLTVVFVGETTNASDIKNSIDDRFNKKFKLTIGDIGKFRRDNGDIYWLGVDENLMLTELYESLTDDLKHKGFGIESREYKPHITLGRAVKLNSEFVIENSKMSMIVDKISLMKSEQINGKITYTEIYSKEIK